MVFFILTAGSGLAEAAEEATPPAAGETAANPIGVSGKLSLFFNKSVSSATSNKFSLVISVTICSNLGEYVLFLSSTCGCNKFLAEDV